MAATLDGLKEYLGLMPDDTEGAARICLDAAIAKARVAGIPALQNNAQYDLFIYALAAYYYDNRGLTVSGSYKTGTTEAAQKMIDAFVLELRHAVEDGP
ncbi:head-tail connector protein [Gehongia tenuis]|uniref:Phage gp6-like head-tail connector protein n=1 Tax=Gehongia tenuis TaxID=2763655 RepID=A0A926D7F4_9FIRM|nr:hypothetical protein [Gehongia tenuis]MBC8531750.1 phage gp6-like head-tail connector protein [Gehongia tenuis]